MTLHESDVEQAAIEWFQAIGYTYVPGPNLTDGAPPERANPQTVLLEARLRAALARINPHLPQQAIDEAVRRIRSLDSRNVAENNQAFHKLLTEGVSVQVRDGDQTRGDKVWLVDFAHPDRNDWLIVNQLTVLGARVRRPDLVVYLNGLPLAVLELKDPTDPRATVQGAYRQLQTYKREIPQLFATNEILMVADGADARLGSLTAGWERFGPWRTIDGSELETGLSPLEVAIRGMFDRRRLLDYLRFFVLFEMGDGIVKKIAGYHQFHAVNRSVRATLAAAAPDGDRRIGVVWHTQGSGKSLSMAFYAAKIIEQQEMGNPTLVVVTDRNDLDQQLFSQFAAARDLLPTPAQAENRDGRTSVDGTRDERGSLRSLLRVASGGIVFTTMQKFSLTDDEKRQGLPYPCLSDRHNVVVIVDEAHRTQYGFGRTVTRGGQVSTGFATNLRNALPNASFIGFTGTPIELDDRSTPEVFGDYIDVYPISSAVHDGSTVPIYYEARLAQLDLSDDEKPHVDEEFEDATETEDERTRAALQQKWASLEALVGTPKRLKLVARDILDHFRRRRETLEGKAMVVAMSRMVAARLYKQLIRLHPDWHSDDDDKGTLKVVITGDATDEDILKQHVRERRSLRLIEKRFKDPDDPLRMVIVVDMWLTGFDVPCAHTMYMDKPLRGHTLMQAIARVNRVWQDKPSGLIVDYLGVANELKQAVKWYDRGRTHEERPGLPIEAALAELQKRIEVVRGLFHGFEWAGFFATDAKTRVTVLVAGMEHILALEDGKERFRKAMAALNKAAGIALHLDDARPFLDEIAFYQAVAATLTKRTTPRGESSEALNAAIRQIVSRAVVPSGVVDVLETAGIDKPDVSILSEAFLSSVMASPHKNLQLETLHKLFKDQLGALRRSNVVQARRFSERLEEALNRYRNRSVDAAEVILELVELARQLRAEQDRTQALNLSPEEVAFYDALADHGNVREVMNDAQLSTIARDLVEGIRNTVSIDWTQKEAVRARMRTKIKRLLRRHDYPPDHQEQAVVTVIEQAEVLCRDWGTNGAPELPLAAEDSAIYQPATPEPSAITEPEPAVMSGLWAEVMELVSDPSMRTLLQAVFEAGLIAPEPGYDFKPGKRVLAELELAWPSARVAVVLPGELPDEVRPQLAKAGWTVFEFPFEVNALLKAIR